MYTYPKKSEKKDKNWYKRYVLAIMSNGLNQRYYGEREYIYEYYEYFHGVESSEKFTALKESFKDDREINLVWLNFKAIEKKVNQLVEQFQERGFDLDMNALSSEAYSRRNQFKKMVFASMRLQDVQEQYAAGMGMDYFAKEVPDDVREIEEWTQDNYKDRYVTVMTAIVNYHLEIYRWAYKRMHLFRDMVVTNRAFCKNEVRNGFPITRLINPMDAVWDTNCNDDHLTDAGFFGEARYMTVEDIAEQYNIKGEALKKLQEQYASNEGNYASGGLSWLGAYGATGSRIFRPWQNTDGSQRALVFSAEWLDTKNEKFKVDKDRHGNKYPQRINEDLIEHLKDEIKFAKGEHKKALKQELDQEQLKGKITGAEKKRGAYIEERTVITLRQATLVGGDMVLDWGEVKNMVRSVENPSVTRLRYHGVVPNYTAGIITSFVGSQISIQDFKNMLANRMQLELAKITGNVLEVDEYLLPEGYTFEDAMHLMKTVGVVPKNSMKHEIPDQNPMLRASNVGSTDTVVRLAEIIKYIDAEQDAVVGMNEAFVGRSTGANQAVGVTQSQVNQGSQMTAIYFRSFYEFETRVLTQYTNLSKQSVTWNPEFYRPIIGDAGVDLISASYGFSAEQFGMTVSPLPPILRSPDSLRALIENGNNQGALTYPQYLDLINLLMHNNTKEAFMKMRRLANKNEAIRIQMQQATDQANREADIAKTKMAQETVVAQQQVAGEYGLAKEKSKGQADKEKIILKGEVDKDNKIAESILS